ncbi:MAG: hypothetical protein WA152_01555 [Microgenomates group bacterium]
MKDNIFFYFKHPIDTIRIKSRQLAVAIEHSAPPVGSTVEEFPQLPVQDAAKALGIVYDSGAITLEDWSPKDQERLKKGQQPLGHPEHRNI